MATVDDSDVPDTGAVFTFGKSKFGVDGTAQKFWIKNDKVIEVTCGDEHTALVAESGRMFMFGSNDWGQLGLGHNNTMQKPSRVKALKEEKVKHVGCGKSHTIVSTESGKLYAFGNNGDSQLGTGDGAGQNNSTPQPVEGVTGTVSMISTGTDHTIVLTEDGDVYVWGGGDAGQLGLGKETTESKTPVKLELESKAVCVSCGYYHTAVVTEDGKLLTFGETDEGKLGQGSDISDQYTPQEVSGIEGKVTWASCGGSHTIAVTDGGKVYSFGQGSNGQLGVGTNNLKSDQPVLVPIKEKIKTSSCGESHSALISNSGKLYTFGDGRHGKLGLGEENFANQFVPSVVKRFAKFTVEKVSCGGCHMLVTAKPRAENGAGDWSESDEEEEEEKKAINPHISALSESIDLSGSFSARNRRRDKLADTMPPSRSSLPPLHAKLPSLTNGSNGDHLSRGLLPSIQPVQEEVTNSAPPKKSKKTDEEKKSDEDTDSEESDDEEDNTTKDRAEMKAKSEQLLKSQQPKPVPRPTPRKQGSKPVPAKRNSKMSPSGSGEDSPKESRPVPKPKPKKVNLESSEEESDESEEEEEPKKKKESKKKQAKKPKKGLLGRKKAVKEESEEEESEEEEEEEETKSKKSKDKKKSKKEDEKETDGKKDEAKAKEDKKKDTKKKGSGEEEESEEEETEDEDEGKKPKKEKKKKEELTREQKQQQKIEQTREKELEKERKQKEKQRRLKEKEEKKAQEKREKEEEKARKEREKEEKKKGSADAKKGSEELKKESTDSKKESTEKKNSKDESAEEDKKAAEKPKPEEKKKSKTCTIL